MAGTSTDNEVIEELLNLEQQRCDAIAEQRWDDLERLLDDDLTHTHTYGLREERDVYLTNLKKSAPRTLERYDMKVRVYGDTAVMTGRQIILQPREGEEPLKNDYEALQVWVKRGDVWRQVAFQVAGVRNT